MKRGNYNNYDNYDKNEAFFKKLASSYAEKSGNELKKELANLSQSADVFSPDKFDEKVKSKIRTAQIRRWTARLMPVAACFIIALTIYVMNIGRHAVDFADNAAIESSSPSAILNYEFVSSKLPPDYVLRKVDYDYKKVIYYIVNGEGVEIILTIEEYEGNINTDGLDTININGKKAYGTANEDFTFMQYKKDNYLYMLTSPYYYGYDDLIKISEKLI